MPPCKVAVVLPDGGGRLDLVIPHDTQITFTNFIEEIRARISKYSKHLSADLILRLNSEDGFLVDQDDRVADIITPTDILFVISAASRAQVNDSPQILTSSVGGTTFQIRAITPLLAQKHRDDVRNISPLENGRQYSTSITLSEIRSIIAAHLGVIIDRQSGNLSVSKVIDLHTAEGPVEASDFELTAGATHLDDLLVNGVLSIYVVERKLNRDATTNKVGKDAMFKAAPHWKLPSSQSERGTAAILSCLRVLSHIMGTEDCTKHQQNEILRLYHHLTAFPPAVRAMHILMDGNTLRANECAVLVQCTAAVLQDLIPKNIIDNDNRRLLEGTRLLFGLILQISSKKGNKHNQDAAAPTETPSLMYLGGYHTVDLRDVKTQNPVKDPVQTNFGLMDRTTYQSSIASSNTEVEMAESTDQQLFRIVILSGGFAREISYYDADVLGAEYLRSSTEILADELEQHSKDLPFLAILCEETQLTVTPPRALSGARHPCLTLDREGFLAVYTGPPPCAPPDRDKAIYRPLTGAEENIDASIVAQLLEPILKDREREGTHVFDLFSNSHRKAASSTELLIFCVDCSESMGKSSNFMEINQPPAQDLDVHLDFEDDNQPVNFGEIKEWLLSHESFDDMLALVTNSTSPKEIIGFLRTVTSRELRQLAKKLEETSSWASRMYVSTHRLQGRVDALRRTLSGLNIFENALCDLITYRTLDFTPTSFMWNFPEPVPKLQRPPATVVDLDLTVPPEYICPIGKAVFRDPVITADGFTYERSSIERWYSIRHSSPLTGLPILDVSLRRNEGLYEQTQSWAQSEDIIEAAPPTRKRARSSGSTSSSSEVRLRFIGPTGAFDRVLRKLSTLADLHKVAFRGMRGSYTVFALHCNGVLLGSSNATLEDYGISSGSEIVATPGTSTTAAADINNDTQEMCLVKVYTPDTREHGEEFAYWVPRSTPVSLMSVVFRFWRYYQHSWGAMHDRDVWSKLHYAGDGAFVGDKHWAWDLLSELFDDLAPTKVLRSEAMCKGNTKQAAQGSDSSEPDWEDSSLESDGSHIPDPIQPHRVLKLELSSYVSPAAVEAKKQQKLRTLTRMGISKQLFGSFVNRLIAYNFPTTVGLVTFGTTATISQPLTDTIENFRNAVDRMEPTGDTALWDALALAADRLINADVAKNSPTVRKRIICLSDGNDTNSVRKVYDVCRLLLQSSIVVDSCSIGAEENSDLRTLSYLTGGYKFVPKTLEEAVAVCELEPVLSQHERPHIVRPIMPAFLTSSGFSLATSLAQPDPVGREVFPTRKSHPNVSDSFIHVTAFDRGRLPSSTLAASSMEISRSGMRTRRLLTELRDVAANPHPSYDVYVSEANMGFWKVVIAGPEDSAYSGGTFVIYLDMGEEYPRAAPKGRFLTPIFHPNINRHGRICHSIFDRNWTVDTTNRQVLENVFGLMIVPEFTDPINTVVTLDYYWDEASFKVEVRKSIAKHAFQSRQALGAEILAQSGNGES